MLRKVGLVLTFTGLLIGFTFFYLLNDNLSLFILSLISVGSLTFTFLGISLLAISSNDERKKRLLKVIFLVIAISFMLICLISRSNKWPGTSIEGVFAIFFYCFAYAPLELYLKYNKWKDFSTNKWDMFLLSTLDFAGINLILLGILTKVLHWPGQLYFVYTGTALLVIGLFLWNARFKQEVVRRKESEDTIKKQFEEIEKEKQISEDLLLNILPEEVAAELKLKGNAEARNFDEVTVLFTDFKDFTSFSERMTPKELVEEIHTCFKAFDQIIETYGLEKIKTIGDSYMCAGGLPVVNNTNAIDAVKAGLEINQFIQNRQLELAKDGKSTFQIRIGIHTGPVIAGIVGIKKFAYDIWGDTVNTASRMESSGEEGKVNVSGATYEKVKDSFVCIHRGKVQAKGKGEIDMYFVVHER